MLIEKRRQRVILTLLGESLIFISLFSVGKIPAAGADLSRMQAYSQSSKTNKPNLLFSRAIKEISNDRQVSTSARDLLTQSKVKSHLPRHEIY